MTTSISLSKSTQREGCFNHPEGIKSQRWEIVFSQSRPDLIESHDVDVLTFTSHFTAYGESSDTEVGAKSSFLKVLNDYCKSYDAEVASIVALNVKIDNYPWAGIDLIEQYRHNCASDIKNPLLVAWIEAFSDGQRTAFDLSELHLIEGYAYILYGTQNFIVDAFGMNSINFSVANEPMFEDFHEFQNVVEQHFE